MDYLLKLVYFDYLNREERYKPSFLLECKKRLSCHQYKDLISEIKRSS